MADRSKIEWTDASWNPVRAAWRVLGQKTQGAGGDRPIGWHCEHVSEGCRNCYAEGFNLRLGTRLDYKPGNRDVIDIFLDEKLLLQPLRWKRPRKIFVGSMTDLFADFVSDDMLDKIFAVVALSPQHTFQFLTKRPARMREYLTRGQCGFYEFYAGDACNRVGDLVEKMRRSGLGMPPNGVGPVGHLQPGARWWPPSNVWLGVSCEDQATTLERCEQLKATPAAVRFVSCEPLLEDIGEALNEFMGTCTIRIPKNVSPIRPFDPDTTTIGGAVSGLGGMIVDNNDRAIDWVIVSGESGPHARPMHADWARSIRNLCACVGVPFFFKQWGEWAPDSMCGEHVRFSARNPGPELHGWPYDEATDTWRIGKRRAGRLLDGIEHNAFPEVANG
ncbi:phage Gp37/Gp68 family protein [Methylovirgula ligni]|uniref:Protein gp37 n=1 Tax=Methylovirgula ligni TaxID=569860 RepID=A0A3D9YMT5_9HYPH|nr:phage Gp37/Gp68 family protein [Methylovirgula ligni]QAY96672.1 phage Gp37/Gp68 family protein [Methylovirgula ligni]REF83288.1 protein gp37 [Methylovirgula ligni]